MNVPAIVFGEHIAALGVVRNLGEHNIPVHLVVQNPDSFCRKSKYVKSSVYLDIQSDRFFENFVKWGLDHVGEKCVIIIAGNDEPLKVLPKHISEFPVGWIATFPNLDIVENVTIKSKTYDVASQIGIKVPKTYAIHSEDELEYVLRTQQLQYPLLLKSERSAELLTLCGAKAHVAKDELEVRSLYQKNARYLGSLLLQKYIKGGNTSLLNYIAVYDNNSDVISWFGNRKIRTSQDFSNCTLMEPYDDCEVKYLADKLIKKIGYTGFANVEFKRDPSEGHLYLMEINGRVSMSVTHAVAHEIHLPLDMYRSALGLQKTTRANLKNTCQKILWWYPFNESKVWFCALRKGPSAVFQLIREMEANSVRTEPFNRKDIMPVIYFIRSWCKSYLSNKISLLWRKSIG